MHIEFWWRKLMLRDNFEDLDVDGNIILSWILKKYDGVKWT